MIDCPRCREYLEDAALQDDAAFDPVVNRHLEKCRECRQFLSRLRNAWTLLPLTLEAEEVNEELEFRVMSRVEQSLGLTHGPRWYAGIVIQYGVAASILIAVVTSLLVWTHRQTTELHVARQQAKQLRRQLDQLNDLKRGFGNPSLHFVSFRDVAPHPQAHAYLLHDLLAQEGHFFAFDLPSLPPPQVYKLWILAEDGQVIAASVLDVDGTEIASAMVPIPGRSGANLRLLVTSEHDSEVATPSEDVRLEAEAR